MIRNTVKIKNKKGENNNNQHFFFDKIYQLSSSLKMITPLSFITHFVIIVYMIQYQSELDTSSKHCIKFNILEKKFKSKGPRSKAHEV